MRVTESTPAVQEDAPPDADVNQAPKVGPVFLTLLLMLLCVSVADNPHKSVGPPNVNVPAVVFKANEGTTVGEPTAPPISILTLLNELPLADTWVLRAQ